MTGDIGAAGHIPHVEYVAQLSRHLAAIPASPSFASSRRGAVAIVLRLVVPQDQEYPALDTSWMLQWSPARQVQELERFLGHPAFATARAQILFIQRAQYPGDPWSGHIGFPGGKREPQDGSDQVTAERETMEELGLRLDDQEGFVRLGRLDDAQAYSVRKGVIMVVAPHVYLQVGRESPRVTLSAEVASVHWIDLAHILARIDCPPKPLLRPWSYPVFATDPVTRFFPTPGSIGSLWVRLLAGVVGGMHYTALPLPFTSEDSVVRAREAADGSADTRILPTKFVTERELLLWGLSLNMVSNLVDLSLPIKPATSTGYVSVASPWPQLDRWWWADINSLTNIAHAIWWRPSRRKPYSFSVDISTGGPTDFFVAYFRLLGVLLPLSCAAKATLAYLAGKQALQYVMNIFVTVEGY
ncbi:hypothetical protein GGF46_000171 [Coemansia sp. RSA 552]|nr:hypothetical protein GGF46_000171 [Coemansia sp. RSA 552]